MGLCICLPFIHCPLSNGNSRGCNHKNIQNFFYNLRKKRNYPINADLLVNFISATRVPRKGHFVIIVEKMSGKEVSHPEHVSKVRSQVLRLSPHLYFSSGHQQISHSDQKQ